MTLLSLFKRLHRRSYRCGVCNHPIHIEKISELADSALETTCPSCKAELVISRADPTGLRSIVAGLVSAFISESLISLLLGASAGLALGTGIGVAIMVLVGVRFAYRLDPA
jgi:hypothetical protein